MRKQSQSLAADVVVQQLQHWQLQIMQMVLL